MNVIDTAGNIASRGVGELFDLFVLRALWSSDNDKISKGLGELLGRSIAKDFEICDVDSTA
jgi:hypothetical protein